MKTYSAVVERDSETGLLVGYVPGFPGAHTQADSLDELNQKTIYDITHPDDIGESKSKYKAASGGKNYLQNTRGENARQICFAVKSRIIFFVSLGPLTAIQSTPVFRAA